MFRAGSRQYGFTDRKARCEKCPYGIDIRGYFCFCALSRWREQKDFSAINTLFCKQCIAVCAHKNLWASASLHSRNKRCELRDNTRIQ